MVGIKEEIALIVKNEDLLNEIDMQLAELGQFQILTYLSIWRVTGDASNHYDKFDSIRDDILKKLAAQDLAFFSTWVRFSLPDLTDKHCASLYETLTAITK